MSLSVYAKADDISIKTKCWGTRCNPRLCKQTHQPCFESDKMERTRWPRSDKIESDKMAEVLQASKVEYFDIFWHLRGSGTVDKMKKYCHDIPRGLSLTSAVDCHLTLRVR